MIACNQNCLDVELKRYFQKSILKKDKIKMVIISESLPVDLADYFDAKGTPQFITNTNIIFNSIGFNFNTYNDYLDHGIYLTTAIKCTKTVSYTHLRAHETDSYLVCRLLL